MPTLKILIIFSILASILILGTSFWFEDTFAQYSGTPTPDIWKIEVELALQEYVDNTLLQNENIVKESIKTRISKTLEDVLPPRYYVRIIYDEIQNNEILHIDSGYKVDFGPVAKTPENTKLEKIFEEEYKPPKKIPIELAAGENWAINWMLQNIMCRQGFEKVVKESTGEALCVKSKSVGKLVDRGWIRMDYFTNKILQNENYDSFHVPISVTYVQPYSEFPDYSWISTKIWNLRNIPSDYSVEVFNPEGDQVKICSKPSADNPQKPHSLNEWKFLLNACGHSKMTGNYTVLVSSNDSLLETFIVDVSNKGEKTS